MYKLLKDICTGEHYGVLKDGKTSIPFASDNTDYQIYLKWLEEGNTPEPADQPEE